MRDACLLAICVIEPHDLVNQFIDSYIDSNGHQISRDIEYNSGIIGVDSYSFSSMHACVHFTHGLALLITELVCPPSACSDVITCRAPVTKHVRDASLQIASSRMSDTYMV